MLTLNPLARVAAVFILLVAVLISYDRVTSSLVIGVVLFLAMWLKFTPGAFLWRLVLLLIAVVPTFVTLLLYAEHSGPVLWSLAWWQISAGSVASAVTTSLRIVALVLPSLVLFYRLEPAAIACSMAQNLGMSQRWALVFTAVLQLGRELAADFARIAVAQRSRGLGGGSPWAALQRGLSLLVAVLVHALRRGLCLADAMQVRGANSTVQRTWLQTYPWSFLDSAFVLASLMLAMSVVGVSIYFGTWQFVY